MKTILVTGGIGAGKSAVCRYLSAKGYPVYDCDSHCKAFYREIPGLRQRIENELSLPFDQWSEIFKDTSKRERLESIVFPILIDDIEDWRSSIDAELCFIESATALDKPQLDGLYDEVWLVEADYDKRLVRNPKAAQRAGLQHFDKDRASVVISNDGTMADLHKTIDKLLS